MMLLAIFDCVPRRTIWRKPRSDQRWKDVESGKYGDGMVERETMDDQAYFLHSL